MRPSKAIKSKLDYQLTFNTSIHNHSCINAWALLGKSLPYNRRGPKEQVGQLSRDRHGPSMINYGALYIYVISRAQRLHFTIVPEKTNVMVTDALFFPLVVLWHAHLPESAVLSDWMGISRDHHTPVLTLTRHVYEEVLIGHTALVSNQSIIDIKWINTPANEGVKYLQDVSRK